MSDRRLPRPLPGPEPGSLSDQRQPAGIEPDVKMILGREGLVSLGIVGRKFERHDTESTAPFTFDNATPPASEPQSLRPPLRPSPTPRNASCGPLGLSESVWICARAPEWGDLPRGSGKGPGRKGRWPPSRLDAPGGSGAVKGRLRAVPEAIRPRQGLAKGSVRGFRPGQPGQQSFHRPLEPGGQKLQASAAGRDTWGTRPHLARVAAAPRRTARIGPDRVTLPGPVGHARGPGSLIPEARSRVSAP